MKSLSKFYCCESNTVTCLAILTTWHWFLNLHYRFEILVQLQCMCQIQINESQLLLSVFSELLHICMYLATILNLLYVVTLHSLYMAVRWLCVVCNVFSRYMSLSNCFYTVKMYFQKSTTFSFFFLIQPLDLKRC